MNIKQVLIPLYYEVHADLHSAMSDDRFYNKWKVHRKSLLFDKNKYIEEQNDILA
jgi:hypothetical protein